MYENRDSLYSKNRNISRYQITNLLKIWFLFFVFTKGQIRDKSEFVSKFVGIIVMIIFTKNFFSNSFWNLCYTVFFHWALETQNRKENNF